MAQRADEARRCRKLEMTLGDFDAASEASGGKAACEAGSSVRFDALVRHALRPFATDRRLAVASRLFQRGE
jgi:hypothetical protein